MPHTLSKQDIREILGELDSTRRAFDAIERVYKDPALAKLGRGFVDNIRDRLLKAALSDVQVETTPKPIV